MSLVLTIPNNKPGDVVKTLWEHNGFDAGDFELGEEVGILTPRSAKELQVDVEFDEMISKEEQFIEDGYDDIDEMIMCLEGAVRKCEVIHPEKIVENVQVRITKISGFYSTGSIDRVNNVYIPNSVIYGSENIEECCEQSKDSQKTDLYKQNENTKVQYGKRSVGELCSMNLVYNPKGKNLWKAIYIHEKPEPFVKAKLVQTIGADVWYVDIVQQDLGKMIGKGGIHIKNIRKDILFNYPEMKHYWDEIDLDYYTENAWRDDYSDKIIKDKWFPKMDINNKNGITQVRIWQDIISHADKSEFSYSGFCPIQGVLKKLYC